MTFEVLPVMRVLLPIFLMLPFLGASQRQANVDFTKINAEILIDLESREINGQAAYEFELTKITDSIFLDAVNMTFFHVALDGKEVVFSNLGEKLGVKAPNEVGKHKLFVHYITKPRQTVYFMGGGPSQSLGQVWTQGQGKYTSHWLPSIDDMTDKIEFDLTLLAEDKYHTVANGKLMDKVSEEGITEWKFNMTNPMSSYLTAFVVGHFDKKIIHSESGIPIELYHEPKDSLRCEPTYRYSKEIFDFLEVEIGVPYPWQNYKQVPVKDFLYAGMENTTCTIFSNQYVIDSTGFVDKNYVNVNAHELAHQWFGNLVTEDSGEHHWLHEGFATYYAYLAERELFGDDHFYWKLYETAETLRKRSENGEGQALTDPKANSLTFYEKGAWALVALRAHIGDGAFRKGVQNYLDRYAFKNARISDFLHQMEIASGISLDDFKKKWLVSTEFPWADVKMYLERKSNSLRTYFGLSSSLAEYQKRRDLLFRIWDGFSSIHLKKKLIAEFTDSLTDASFLEKLKDENVKVRQAMVFSIEAIPTEYQKDFEAMLSDASYLTQEALLFKLWQAFPEKQNKYLDKLEGVVGLPNKNVRLLWLTLALITENYRTEEKKFFYEELNGYTNSQYNFEVRQLAFQYLFQIRALSDKSLQNLLQAANHHVWQFKKSSRNLLREINESDQGKERLMQLALDKEEKELLNTILNP